MSIVYSAAPTPFRSDLSLDLESMVRMVEANISNGVRGFFLCGNMGEWSQLSLRDREELTECAVAAAHGRAEILTGCTANSFHETAANMKALARWNPDAFVIMSPLPATSQYRPVEYLLGLLDVSDRPVYYYHCPSVTGVKLGVNEFERLLAHPNLRGIKNSAGDIGIRKELLKLKQDHAFLLLEGHEWGIDEALMCGCDGVLCGLAGLAARTMAGIANAVDVGDFAAARKLQLTMLDIYHGIYGIDTSTVQNGHKYALFRRGVFSGWSCRNAPDSNLSNERRREIDACLEHYHDCF